ncbi:LamG-like jellyroll fold domain-containing protein [Pedobacter sp.]|uniref:LamG-like jellyroll fold domain-containing protein n=1 Tax=Pedobacter sp. TaxID=1411316 RepID=UPI003D7FA88D
MKIKTVKLLLLLLPFLLHGYYADAQNWLGGYRYRKLITIEKVKVENDPTAFNQWINHFVLLQLEHQDLRYENDAFEPKISHPQGLDISFALSTSPQTVLKFQLESYDAALGKLVCWVQIPSLVTKAGNTSTAVYVYYGSTNYHNPLAPATQAMWNSMYPYVNHFNEGVEGVVGTAASFNGNRRMLIKPQVPTTFTFSTWIKLNTNNQEQMIIANDTAGRGGFQLKINTEGKPVFTSFGVAGSRTVVSNIVLQANVWYLISVNYRSDRVVEFLVNGVIAGNFSALLLMGSGGQVVIGSSKQQDQYFNGLMDELRISDKQISRSWFLTEFNMLRNPAGMFSVGAEAVNMMLNTTYTFTGAVNNIWLDPDNWTLKAIPGDGRNIRIKAGAKAEIIGNLTVNKLLLESGAQLNLLYNLYASQKVELQSASILTARSTSTMQLEGDVLNNGSILTDGKLLVRGNKTSLTFNGDGQVRVGTFEVNLNSSQAPVNLQSQINIGRFLNLLSGHVQANGNIVLLATATQSAAVAPIATQASITGELQVQKYVDGAFPEPATGRGWRLWSAPIWHNGTHGNYQYHMNDLQQAVFVTGKGGPTNGFDASPNNGATIYTHDQTLTGTLAQKYLPITSMQTEIPVGRGFFIYSRGNRLLPQAFTHQVQTPPFSNAEPYIITYKGQLFTGNLEVAVANLDSGGEGDGFNLLGNPYASPIRWGSLQKTNIGPFVWLFDPLNNTYIVSDDPNTLIPSGAGFFIRVINGAKSGTLGFSESAKVTSSL